MTPQEWMNKSGAIPLDAEIEEIARQFDVLLGELMDAWPISQLTEEEYDADVAMLAQGMRGPAKQIAQFLLGVSEYRALWIVPACVAWTMRHQSEHNVHIFYQDLTNYQRFFTEWGAAVAKAAALKRQKDAV